VRTNKKAGENMEYYDIIGDIHGCYEEFVQLTRKLDYSWEKGYPIHPKGRKLVFLGDLTDRGPLSIKVIETVHTIVKNKLALYTPGNHCDKLYRFFLGRNVQIKHGLETTVAEFKALDSVQQEAVSSHFKNLYEEAPLYLTLDNQKLIVAHAGIKRSYIGRTDKKVKTFVLYGDITGETHPDGRPVRRDWAGIDQGEEWIVYGHTPVKKPRILNHTINIDTGCVFGGQLSAFRYPEREIVSVPSSMPYLEEKFQSFD
jgi:protein phosphatase